MTTVVLPYTLDLNAKGRTLFQLDADLVCEVRMVNGDPEATVNAVMVDNVDILDCGDDVLEAIGHRFRCVAVEDNDFQTDAVEKAGYVMRGDARNPSSKWVSP